MLRLTMRYHSRLLHVSPDLTACHSLDIVVLMLLVLMLVLMLLFLSVRIQVSGAAKDLWQVVSSSGPNGLHHLLQSRSGSWCSGGKAGQRRRQNSCGTDQTHVGSRGSRSVPCGMSRGDSAREFRELKLLVMIRAREGMPRPQGSTKSSLPRKSILGLRVVYRTQEWHAMKAQRRRREMWTWLRTEWSWESIH